MFNDKLIVHKHPSDQIESPWEGAGGREGRPPDLSALFLERAVDGRKGPRLWRIRWDITTQLVHISYCLLGSY